MRKKSGLGWKIITGATVVGAKGVTTAPASHPDNDFNAPIDVTPIVKAAKTRARAACALWADANADLIAKKRETSCIGNWRTTVSALFDALSDEERQIWEDKAQALKAQGIEVDLDNYYE